MSRSRVLERLFGIPRLINFNHERNRRFAVVRIWLANILARDSVQQLEIGVPAPFHHSAAELRFAVRILEIKDGNGNPRVAGSIPGLHRTSVRADDEMVAFATDPNWRAVRRAIEHDG